MQEWQDARKNSLTAFYTDLSIVEAVWAAARHAGFDGGRALDIGCGAGVFIGAAPAGTDMVGIEVEPVSAQICRLLYPPAHILNESFADTTLPEGSFDLTIGNPPFGKTVLHDPVHNRGGAAIHHHAVLKSIALTRPGGLVMVITLCNTLDGRDKATVDARRAMADRADLVGAARLPGDAFQRTSGTAVVTDVLVFRVREPGALPGTDQEWVAGRTRDRRGYYTDYPENDLTARNFASVAELGVALGTALTRIVDRAKADGLGYLPFNGQARPLAELLAAGQAPIEGTIAESSDVATRERSAAITKGKDQGKTRTWIEESPFTQIANGKPVPIFPPKSQHDELRALIKLRDLVRGLLAAEAEDDGDTPGVDVGRLRMELNRAYDAYVATYQPINRFGWSQRTDPATGAVTTSRIAPAQGGFRSDPGSALVYALEIFDADTQTARKASIFTRRTQARREIPTSASTPQDAVSLAADRYGIIRIDAVAKLLGTDSDTAREAVRGLVFTDPSRSADVLVPRADYLSGNVRRKLREAEAAAVENPAFAENVQALAEALPLDLTPGQIDGRLGAPWIDTDYVQQFLREVLEDRTLRVERASGTLWAVRGDNRSIHATSTWGTERRPAPALAQALLEQRPILVADRITTADGRERDVLNEDETEAAQAKATELQERFTDWLWEDADRAAHLVRLYNELHNSEVERPDDTTPLVLPGLRDGFDPHPHQYAAVRRMVADPAVLLAHVVGAGKSAEMAIGIMELKRLGLASKPCMIVPNHLLGQATAQFLQTYPRANVLAADSSTLADTGSGSKGDARRRFLARAAASDWDVVIMTHKAFESIPVSEKVRKKYLEREVDQLRIQLARAQERADGSLTVRRIEGVIANAERHIKRQLDAHRKDTDGVSFELSGIDYLVVDEAHEFKNLRIVSTDPDLSIAGSNKATDLHMKLGYLREKSQTNRVVTFATGTPVANSIAEAYTMIRYLRPDLLQQAGITDFDTWRACFGRSVTEMEVTATGGFKTKSRFKSFANTPELLRLVRAFCDVKTAEDLNLPVPELVGGAPEDVVVPAYDELQTLTALRLAGLEADDSPAAMLKYINWARGAALDLRLVAGPGFPAPKLEAAADRIAAIYREHRDTRYPVDPRDPDAGTQELPGALQLVFADLGTPKDPPKVKRGEEAAEQEAEEEIPSLNLYAELRALLEQRGVPPQLVRFIHDATTTERKTALYAECRAGKVAVLIGSTAKMGAGMNVQDRAIALHHLDVPWRPADLEQREGRIIRQGNLHRELGIPVRILRYIAEGSVDAYLWQTVRNKATFISQLMRGNLDVREVEDVGEVAMSYAMASALATGNPLMLERAETDDEVKRLERLERKHHKDQQYLGNAVTRGRADLERLTADIAAYDAALRERRPTLGDAFAMSVGQDVFRKRPDAAAALRNALLPVYTNGWQVGDGPEVEIGRLGGFAVVAHGRRLPGEEREVVVGLRGVPGEAITVTGTQLRADALPGTITRLENRLGGIEKQRSLAEMEVARVSQETARAERRVGDVFPGSTKLALARSLSAALTDLIAAEEKVADERVRQQVWGARRKEDPEAEPSKEELQAREQLAKAEAKLVKAAAKVDGLRTSNAPNAAGLRRHWMRKARNGEHRRGSGARPTSVPDRPTPGRRRIRRRPSGRVAAPTAHPEAPPAPFTAHTNDGDAVATPPRTSDESSAGGRRFADVDALRGWLADVLNNPELSTTQSRERRRRRHVAEMTFDAPTLELSTGGRLAVYEDDGGSNRWRVLVPGTLNIVTLPAGIPTREHALAVAAAIESLRDSDGQPITWDHDDAAERATSVLSSYDPFDFSPVVYERLVAACAAVTVAQTDLTKAAPVQEEAAPAQAALTEAEPANETAPSHESTTGTIAPAVVDEPPAQLTESSPSATDVSEPGATPPAAPENAPAAEVREHPRESDQILAQLATLRPDDVARYLAAKGWHRLTAEVSNGEMWRAPEQTEPSASRLYLPQHPELRDFAERMGDLVQAVATYEGRPPQTVLETLSTVTALETPTIDDAATTTADEPPAATASGKAGQPPPGPWDERKFSRRIRAGIGRNQRAPWAGGTTIPANFRSAWDRRHPYAQMSANLAHVLDELSPQPELRELVSSTVHNLLPLIERQAAQAREDYRRRIAAVMHAPEDELQEALDEFIDDEHFLGRHHVAVATAVMHAADAAERTARQRGVRPSAVVDALDEVFHLVGASYRGPIGYPLFAAAQTPIDTEFHRARAAFAHLLMDDAFILREEYGDSLIELAEAEAENVLPPGTVIPPAALRATEAPAFAFETPTLFSAAPEAESSPPSDRLNRADVPPDTADTVPDHSDAPAPEPPAANRTLQPPTVPPKFEPRHRLTDGLDDVEEEEPDDGAVTDDHDEADRWADFEPPEEYNVPTAPTPNTVAERPVAEVPPVDDPAAALATLRVLWTLSHQRLGIDEQQHVRFRATLAEAARRLAPYVAPSADTPGRVYTPEETVAALRAAWSLPPTLLGLGAAGYARFRAILTDAAQPTPPTHTVGTATRLPLRPRPSAAEASPGPDKPPASETPPAPAPDPVERDDQVPAPTELRTAAGIAPRPRGDARATPPSPPASPPPPPAPAPPASPPPTTPRANRRVRGRLRVALTAAVHRAERIVRGRVFRARNIAGVDRAAFALQLRQDMHAAQTVMARAWDDQWWRRARPEEIGRAWQAGTEWSAAGDDYAVATLAHMRDRIAERFAVVVPEHRPITRADLMQILADPSPEPDQTGQWFAFTIHDLGLRRLVTSEHRAFPPDTPPQLAAARLLQECGFTNLRIELTHSSADGAPGAVAARLDSHQANAVLAAEAEREAAQAAAARLAASLDDRWWQAASPLEVGAMWEQAGQHHTAAARRATRQVLADRASRTRNVELPLDASAVQITETLAAAAGGRLVRVDTQSPAPLEALGTQVFDKLSQARLLERQAQRTEDPARADALRRRAGDLQTAVDELLDRSARIAEAAETPEVGTTAPVGLRFDQAEQQYRAMWGRELRPEEATLLRNLLRYGYATPNNPPRQSPTPAPTRTRRPYTLRRDTEAAQR